MMLEDYLRLHMKLIADHFGAEVTDSDQYCRGTRCYDWRTGAPIQKTAGEYEKDLAEFLLTDPAGISKQGLDALVVIGGIGTGKSTTLGEMIRKIDSESRECSAANSKDKKCHEKPIVINFNIADILGESGRQKVSKEAVKAQVANFWNIAASRLEKIITNTYTFDDEVNFWNWALDHAGIQEHSRFLHRWLNEAELQIRAFIGKKPYSGWTLDQLAQSLERHRAALMHAPDRDLVWYRVYQLLHAATVRKLFGCRCRYIFLDNVDQLEPDVQRDVVDFVILLSDVLHARVLIFIRPLTWDRSVHAAMLVRTQNHFSPALRDVLLARLRHLQATNHASHELISYLRSLILTFTAPKTIWGNLFDATSGLSVRFAIRNFLNLIQSPLLPPLTAHADPLAKLKVSQIARAFFFGEGENILHENLENLYALGTDMRREYRLIKSRILDYLIRVCDNGATELQQLETTMAIFKYSPRMLVKAVNDLLLSTRPLVWSQDGHQISSLNSRAKIAVTPIGRGYHSKLFGQLYYDEVCIARFGAEVVSLDRVLAFHRELWLQDQEEILYAVRKQGRTGFYRSLYPSDKPAISAIHAINLREGVEKRDVEPPPGYDAQRLEFITAEVEKLLARW